MNRRNFIIGAAIFPVAISLPIDEDPYDRFLRELSDNAERYLEHGRLEKLWIEPPKDGHRLVHLVVGGREIKWYQYYGR
jgi:hypothetical protein